MKGYERVTAIGLSLTLASGCGGGGYGGGGSGGGGYMNLSSAPGEAALTSYVQANHSTTLHAMDSSGNSWTAQIVSTFNSGTTTFNGTANAYSTTGTFTLSKNGTQVVSSTSTSYFLLNPWMPLGFVSSGGTPYAVEMSFSGLPTTVMVGDSGAFSSLTYYHDSTKTKMDGTQTATYSVQANNATTLLACLNGSISGVTAQGTADGLTADMESDCYSVDASGHAALFSIRLTSNGVILNFM